MDKVKEIVKILNENQFGCIDDRDKWIEGVYKEHFEMIAQDIAKLFVIGNVSKVKEFICPDCRKMVPIVKFGYECECGVKHEEQINTETTVCPVCSDELMQQTNSTNKNCVRCGETVKAN